MKAIGADSLKITSIFISEGIVIGLTGGFIGYALSLGVSQYIGLKVFDTMLDQRIMLLPVSLGSALFISVTGSIIPVRRALRIKPAVVLKGAE
jgi:putative ABC transport system permease protein